MSTEDKPLGVTVKLVVLGDHGVGKTSITERYVGKYFNHEGTPTIGATFSFCNIQLDDSTSVKLQIWDTAGQERFKAIAPMFYRNANVAVIVYDITRAHTFENMKQWVEQLQQSVMDQLIIFVVGSKLDLENAREVSENTAMEYSDSIGAKYFECSALLNKGIDEIFQSLAQELLLSNQILNGNETTLNETITVDKSRKNSSNLALVQSNCCYRQII